MGVSFSGYTVVALLKHLFTSDRVTVNTISASLCAYLLLGVLWAIVYPVTETLAPGSFGFGDAGRGGHASMRFGSQNAMFALYYSLVTLSTLGYGDITPVLPTARMLAAMQAVVGQLYLAVLVARLVGLQIASGSSGAKRDCDES